MTELCGECVCHLIAGGSYFPCALPKGHDGKHQAAGDCTEHGTYLGSPMQPPRCPKCWPDKVAWHNEDAITAAQTRIQQLEVVVEWLRDLVRHKRAELHEDGLISDEEYAALAEDHIAVDRLETYDKLKAEVNRLQVRDKLWREMVMNATTGRCPTCGWPLADDAEHGCVVGICSLRLRVGDYRYDTWKAKAELLREAMRGK